MVFRVGASGSNLGSNSATFAATELATRLGQATTELRVAIVAADDAYAKSVADAAAATSAALGLPVVAARHLQPGDPGLAGLMDELAAGATRRDHPRLAHPRWDRVPPSDAGIGPARSEPSSARRWPSATRTSPASWAPTAIGIFASDRPTGGFQPDGAGGRRARRLRPIRRGLGIAAASAEGSGPRLALRNATPSTRSPVRPSRPTAAATEEALSGFTAGWALFHDVLPAAAAAG